MRLPTLLQKCVAVTAAAFAALCAIAGQAEAGYLQTNLVSDIVGLADITDPALVNPWGVSHSGTSPFWTSNQGMLGPAGCDAGNGSCGRL
jgi:hypothetical protein